MFVYANSFPFIGNKFLIFKCGIIYKYLYQVYKTIQILSKINSVMV
ncbi:hypothetical protein A1OE_1214 [Candidatus Endolissoclinum faulkneri L2]|uniref:Uncharacterized protein n=1 Tax=Candidatus Endolissoclinum faulkneri L2 TaxID=1193729 RepID=K7YIF1_9PROT|nr:hypothetical protein A1OE_1214 [Candidatus Endolissoclinum faulkneri L2]